MSALARVLGATALMLVLAACTTSAPLSRPAVDESLRTAPVELAKDSPAATVTVVTTLRPGEQPTPLSELRVSTAGWKTDFSKRSVPGHEIASGGPPRDGIPPIDHPKFVSTSEAAAWLKDNEPVVTFEEKHEARAYPLQILIWHEIVNDEVAGRPVAVTFCPLCNTAIAFDRRLDGRVLDFGTTGNLRFSDLVMYDRQTESWWQQITGEAIIGELTGSKLQALPAQITSFAAFKNAFPAGVVLSRETGYQRSYGHNPYVGYDDVDSSPFLFSGTVDGRLRPMERVVTVSLGGEDVAYPLAYLEQTRVVHDRVGGRPVVVFFGKGTASVLDASSIAASRDVGSAGVFEPIVGGRPLTFQPDGAHFVDAETGTRWDILGRATDGPLAGQRLNPIVSGTHFWFAWAVFKPQTRVVQN